MILSRPHLIIIGTSAGGPATLLRLFKTLGAIDAAVIVVQHMPDYMSTALASSIQRQTTMPCAVATHNQIIKSGEILVAPGDYHLRVSQSQRVHLDQGEFVQYVRPAVDVTMLSIQENVFQSVTGVILTGLGQDGSAGIRHLKSLGAHTIAQDKETSAVFGMPRAAAETGVIDQVLPLDEIAKYLKKTF